jgi:hypothetical protein
MDQDMDRYLDPKHKTRIREIDSRFRGQHIMPHEPRPGGQAGPRHLSGAPLGGHKTERLLRAAMMFG